MIPLHQEYFRVKDKHPNHLVWFKFEQGQDIIIIGECAIKTQKILKTNNIIEVAPNFYQIKFSDYILDENLMKVIRTGNQVALIRVKGIKKIDTIDKTLVSEMK